MTRDEFAQLARIARRPQLVALPLVLLAATIPALLPQFLSGGLGMVVPREKLPTLLGVSLVLLVLPPVVASGMMTIRTRRLGLVCPSCGGLLVGGPRRRGAWDARALDTGSCPHCGVGVLDKSSTLSPRFDRARNADRLGLLIIAYLVTLLLVMQLVPS